MSTSKIPAKASSAEYFLEYDRQISEARSAGPGANRGMKNLQKGI
jgi:hypothetical protein